MLFKFQPTEFKKAKRELAEINSWEATIKKMTDEQLKDSTRIFRERLQRGETTDDIRVEAFAVAREATTRVLKKRPYDVQMVGGLVLDYGSVAEMKTGEGKTITSIAPIYLNALSGKGVMVSTVNEYLTQRDAEEMGVVYNFLGLTYGVNLKDMQPDMKRNAYAQDITYSVHSEIGFDYLRDNMVKSYNQKVQRPYNFVLIDEVDSILIDEARTPLIITGGAASNSKLYEKVDSFVKSIKEEDYDIDHESKGIQLTDAGIVSANKFFNKKNIFSLENSELVHRIQNSLRANKIFKCDFEYIVRDGKIELVDAHSGRIMEGRSYSDGLHQAIQAKEGVEIEDETQTLATVTYQNLFRMFPKLSGMSGTAKTEEDEFLEIYNMRVIEIPTNRPVIRVDMPDEVYATTKAKYKAIIGEIKKAYEIGQPVLVGTQEVFESEKISKMLSKENIRHTVLNAKQNDAEAEQISQAGQKGSITVATNMAGRGTDIKPSQESLSLGGLYVIGTNKAESRRIDNQLKGRSGRQGDVGKSKFLISLDDVLIKRFSNQDKLKSAFSGSGDNAINSKSAAKLLSRAQKKIEGFNFDSRKNVLQYDDVIRQQRDLIYSQRDLIIKETDLIHVIRKMMSSVAREIIKFDNFISSDGAVDPVKLVATLNKVWYKLSEYKMNVEVAKKLSKSQLSKYISKDMVEVYDVYRQRVIDNTSEATAMQIEREIILTTFDKNWQLHLDQMTKLRSNSSLASYAQKNPYQIYLEKGSELFKELIKRISHNSVKQLMNNRYAVRAPESAEQARAAKVIAKKDIDQRRVMIMEKIKRLKDKGILPAKPTDISVEEFQKIMRENE